MDRNSAPLYEQGNPEVEAFHRRVVICAPDPRLEERHVTAAPRDPLAADADRRVAFLLREGAL